MIRTTLATLALITAAGVAHAQMQAPSTPGGRAMDSMPGGTSNPSTDFPKTPSNASAAEAAAKSAIEQRGYIGVKSLTRDMAGNWAAKAMRDNVEVAVILEPSGNIRAEKSPRPSLAGWLAPLLRPASAAGFLILVYGLVRGFGVPISEVCALVSSWLSLS